MDEQQTSPQPEAVEGRDGLPGTAVAFFIAVVVIVAVAGGLRHGDFRAVREQHVELGPDAKEYLTIARQMTHFYWPSSREPLFPALVRVATWFVGPTATAPRLVSFTFSMLLVAAVALVGWRLYGRGPALAASLFVAVFPYYLFTSTEGIRLEVYSCLLLLFIWLLTEKSVSWAVRQLLCAGFVGGLLCLTRMTSFVLVIPALVWFVWARRGEQPLARKLRVAGVASVLLVAVMVAPYLYVCHRDLGDSLVWINRHATWWHYQELREEQARAGLAFEIPSPEPGEEGEYPVSIMDYLLRERPVAGSLRRMVRGYGDVFWVLGRVFADDVRNFLRSFLLWVGVIGYVGLARGLWRGPGLPVLVFLLSLLPVSFVVPVGANPRLFLHVLPLWVLWWAWGLAWPLQRIYPHRRAAAPPPPAGRR